MSGINTNHEVFDKALSAALREAVRSAPSGAPPEVGISLALAFRRHRLRRRMIRSGVLTAVLLIGGGVWFFISSPASVQPRKRKAAVELKPIQSIVSQSAAPVTPAQRQIAQTPRVNYRRHATVSLAKAEWFVALPAYALRTPDETLRVVRVEMPASSLRLLGAPVRGEIADRRINADLLVGPDGTPYAVRLVL